MIRRLDEGRGRSCEVLNQSNRHSSHHLHAQSTSGRRPSSGASRWPTSPTTTAPRSSSPSRSSSVSHMIHESWAEEADGLVGPLVDPLFSAVHCMKSIAHPRPPPSPQLNPATTNHSRDRHRHHLVALLLRHHARELQPLLGERLHGRHGELPAVPQIHRRPGGGKGLGIDGWMGEGNGRVQAGCVRCGSSQKFGMGFVSGPAKPVGQQCSERASKQEYRSGARARLPVCC